MAVDMYRGRFLDELAKLPAFVPRGKWNAAARDVGFPAWRALFSSLVFYGHSTGYRLFSFDVFFKYCRKAYQKSKKLAPYFEETHPLHGAICHRLSTWYESGMAETYLYACLAEALEDKAKCGMVLYDPRVDWKLKGDVVVIIGTRHMMVSSYYGEKSGRARIIAHRDKVERIAKVNTMESAHWGNTLLVAMPVLEIARNAEQDNCVQGINLFTLSEINGLLEKIYQLGEVESKRRWFFAAT